MYRFFLYLSFALLLTGCGGQSTTSPPAPPTPNAARGLYLSGYYNSVVTTIVLPDGRFYVPLRKLVAGGSQLSGVAVGQGTASSNTFTGTYRYSGELNRHFGTINATFVPGASFNGTLSENGSDLPLSGIVYPPDQYNMDTPASSAAISGYWVAGMLGGCGLRLTLAAHGTIEGVHNSIGSCTCDFSGTFSPDATSNFYNVTLNFPASGCPLQNPATGIAVLYKYRLPDSMTIDEFAMVVLTEGGAATVITGGRDPSNPRPIP